MSDDRYGFDHEVTLPDRSKVRLVDLAGRAGSLDGEAVLRFGDGATLRASKFAAYVEMWARWAGYGRVDAVGGAQFGRGVYELAHLNDPHY